MSSSAVDVSDIDFTKKSALVFGTESTGLSDAWKNVEETV
jgi:tRNA G18 (ribose-2'-O)-methylase SpoU